MENEIEKLNEDQLVELKVLSHLRALRDCSCVVDSFAVIAVHQALLFTLSYTDLNYK